jgi:hypothetical protein
MVEHTCDPRVPEAEARRSVFKAVLGCLKKKKKKAQGDLLKVGFILNSHCQFPKPQPVRHILILM